jgi:serine/threonine protein kinase
MPPKRKYKTYKCHKGGKLVASGAYGCGFIPALVCEGDQTRPENIFSKFMKNEDAEVEWHIRSKVAIIDPDQQYTVYPTHKCRIDPDKLTETNDIDHCYQSLLSNINKKNIKKSLTDNYTVLQIPIGGSPLDKINVTDATYISYFRSMRKLFNGLTMMHSNDLYHLDIKPDNILALETSGDIYNIRYIDFGMSKTPEEFMKDASIYLQNNYMYWPFDLQLLKCYKAHTVTDINKLISDSLNKFYMNALLEKQKINGNIWFDGQLHIPSGAYYANNNRLISVNDYVNVYMKMMNMVDTDGKEELIRFILAGVDVYALGMTLAIIFMKRTGIIYKNNKFYNLSDSMIIDNNIVELQDRQLIEVATKIYSLISKMIHYDPFERISIRDAYIEYNEFIKIIERYSGAILTKPNSVHYVTPVLEPDEISAINKYTSNILEVSKKPTLKRKFGASNLLNNATRKKRRINNSQLRRSARIASALK